MWDPISPSPSLQAVTHPGLPPTGPSSSPPNPPASTPVPAKCSSTSLQNSFQTDWEVSPAQTPSEPQVAYNSISLLDPSLLLLFPSLPPHYSRPMGPSNSPLCLLMLPYLPGIPTPHPFFFFTRPNRVFLDLAQTSPPSGSLP